MLKKILISKKSLKFTIKFTKYYDFQGRDVYIQYKKVYTDEDEIVEDKIVEWDDDEYMYDLDEDR